MSYTVSTKTKKVYADLNKLTDYEQKAVSLYLQSGYELKPKRKVSGNKKPNKAAIYHYFATNKDIDGLKAFEMKCNEKIVDKNGNKRKGGFLVGRSFLLNELAAANKSTDFEMVEELTTDEKKWIEENK